MRLTFLGTGTSTGVPSIACDCETCTSDDPRDQRLRVSILIEHAGQTIIVDTSTDFRQQALRRRLKQVQMERDILAKATAWFAGKSERTSTTSSNS